PVAGRATLRWIRDERITDVKAGVNRRRRRVIRAEAIAKSSNLDVGRRDNQIDAILVLRQSMIHRKGDDPRNTVRAELGSLRIIVQVHGPARIRSRGGPRLEKIHTWDRRTC